MLVFFPILSCFIFLREQDQCDEWNCDNLFCIFSEYFCVGVFYELYIMFIVLRTLNKYMYYIALYSRPIVLCCVYGWSMIEWISDSFFD